MSTFDDAFDAERPLEPSCACGLHRSQAEHDHEARATFVAEAVASEDRRYEGVVNGAVIRALFPQDATRRAFLKTVGASTALAAIAQFLPLRSVADAFAQGAASAIEKKDLKVGFIPITCATPIIMAAPMGCAIMIGVPQVIGMKPTLRSFFSRAPPCANASVAVPSGKNWLIAASAVEAPTDCRKARRLASFGNIARTTADATTP